MGETRHQQLRSFPFTHTPLFHSHLVNYGEEFLLKRHPQKHSGLEALSKPDLSWSPPPTHTHTHTTRKKAPCIQSIQSLLNKKAIESVENTKSLGFCSHLFLVPKPHQEWRPVIHLSRLNTFSLVEKFKMEISESIRASLFPVRFVNRPLGCISPYPNSQPGKVRTQTHSSLFICGLRIPSGSYKTHDRQMAQLQDLILNI